MDQESLKSGKLGMLIKQRKNKNERKIIKYEKKIISYIYLLLVPIYPEIELSIN